MKARDAVAASPRTDLIAVPRLGAAGLRAGCRVSSRARERESSRRIGRASERYALVERIASDLGVLLLIWAGNEAQLQRVKPERWRSDDVGLPTLHDILTELRKPGRDPREAFEAPAFRPDITEPKHLTEGWSSMP
jgi:uncharacterized protein